jgi:hypothetical protein
MRHYRRLWGMAAVQKDVSFLAALKDGAVESMDIPLFRMPNARGVCVAV